MAGAKEIGIGVAKAIASSSLPDPFPLTFRGETASEAAAIILAIITECEDADIRLKAVELDPELFRAVIADGSPQIPVYANEELRCEARFIRGD